MAHQYFRELSGQSESHRNLGKPRDWLADAAQSNGTVIYHNSVRSPDDTLLDHRSAVLEDTSDQQYQLV